MVRRALLAAAFLACFLLPAEGATPPLLRFPFWACSDGKGTISLFFLPPAGEWPAGGYRLERVSRGRATVLGGPLRPGQDARAMMEIAPGDADAIRALADGIERGTLSDDEKSRSISGLGRAAAADAVLGRALGVRYTDVPRVRGKVVYRLTALGADGGSGSVMESAEVDPGKPTPGPGRPARLRAEEHDDGVALFWTDPPAGPVAPVVGYRVDRGDGGRRAAALTPKPLRLERHLRQGEPEFLDGTAPAKKVTYRVRGVDVFGRLSAPAQAAIAIRKAGHATAAAGAQAPTTRPSPPAATAKASPAASSGIAAATPGPAGTSPETPAGKRRMPAPAPARDESPPAASGSAARPAPATTAASATEDGRGGSSSRVPVPPATLAAAATARMEARLSTPAPATVPAAAQTPAPGTPRAAVPAPENPEPVVWTAAKEEPTARQGGSPPRPLIVGIAGMADRVVVRFRPGEPEDLTEGFLVIRSESPTGPGATIGRPIPGGKREWEDTTVSAGQYFWYRLVAVDGRGNRSEPSAPKWVSTGSR